MAEKFYGDRACIRVLKILCTDCSEPIPDSALDRLFSEEEISLNCKACGAYIVIILSDIDALCDSLVRNLEEQEQLAN